MHLDMQENTPRDTSKLLPYHLAKPNTYFIFYLFFSSDNYFFPTSQMLWFQEWRKCQENAICHLEEMALLVNLF